MIVQDTASTFGEFLKRRRLEMELTLRRFCAMHEFDPGYISKIERGVMKPPLDSEKFEKIAKALGLTPGGDDWIQLKDLADVDNRKIPEGILSDAELARRLPVFLRTLGNRRLTPEQLDILIERIREA